MQPAEAVHRTAVILARGLGKRMREHDGSVNLDAQQEAAAGAGVKGMINVGRPFLEYLISALADAGITDVVLVTGPEHDAVRTYFTSDAPPSRVRMHFAVQVHAHGTADAVAAAADVVSKVVMHGPFMVLNADNYYPVDAYRALLQISGAGVVGFDRDALVRESNIDVERVRSFAILDVAADSTLRAIVEKPGGALDLSSPDARWVGMNLWMLTPAVVDACRRVPLSTRGEFELPEAVALALNEGVRFQVVKQESGVLDLSRRADIGAVASRLAGIEVRL